MMNAETAALIRSALRGASQISTTTRGVVFDRLPVWTSAHHQHDPLTGQVSRQGSGVRLEFETSASEITLIYRATLDSPSRPSAVTIRMGGNETTRSHDNGNRRVWSADGTVEFIEGEDSVASFKLEPATEPRRVTLWLPHNCSIEIIDLSANAVVTPAVPLDFKWTHYGSSISHCVEANEPLGAWPSRIAQDLDLNLTSLGLAGSANVEYFAAKTIAEIPADLITLKLGINVVAGATMTRRTFIPAVEAMLDVIREQQPETKIVVISPIFCPGLETQPGPVFTDAAGQVLGSEFSPAQWVGQLTLQAVREILEEIVVQRGDERLSYLDGLELFSNKDVDLMPDHLHPNAEGYLLMAERAKRLLFS
jgi:lysophospholipase L1-like esterase